jgi:hypothetical protein
MRLLIPIIVILAGVALAFFLNSNGSFSYAVDDFTEKVKILGESTNEPVIFRVWLHEVEANSVLPNGAKWDQDGSAPDLSAELYWQEIRLLETGLAKDSLISRWSPTNLSVGKLLDGSVNQSDFESVATLRTVEGTYLEIAVYENDLVQRSFVGLVRIPATALQKGIVNLPINRNGIAYLKLAVVSGSGELELLNRQRNLDSFEWLTEQPEYTKSSVERSVDSVSKDLETWGAKGRRALEELLTPDGE